MAGDAKTASATAPAAMDKLGRAIGARNRQASAWDKEHDERPDPEVFRSEILPGLKGVSLSRIIGATGLSKRHSSRIRNGSYT